MRRVTERRFSKPSRQQQLGGAAFEAMNVAPDEPRLPGDAGWRHEREVTLARGSTRTTSRLACLHCVSLNFFAGTRHERLDHGAVRHDAGKRLASSPSLDRYPITAEQLP